MNEERDANLASHAVYNFVDAKLVSVMRFIIMIIINDSVRHKID